MKRLTGVLVMVALLLTACGKDAQTLQPYTPAMGVNADVGPDRTVKVRNLLIVSREDNQGFISASIVSSEPDALVGVGGRAVERKDGTPGAPLQSNLSSPIALEPDVLVVLTERPVIRVTSPDLWEGATARVVLEFERAGELELLVPIYRDQAELASISPIPRTPSPAADPSPGGTP